MQIFSGVSVVLVLSVLWPTLAAYAAGDAIAPPTEELCYEELPPNPVEVPPVRLNTRPCPTEDQVVVAPLYMTGAEFAQALGDIEAQLERNEALLAVIQDGQTLPAVVEVLAAPPNVTVVAPGPRVLVQMAPVTVTVTESGEPTVVIIPAE
jgi:hypothetical protein